MRDEEDLRRVGRDEMNLCEFPIATLADRVSPGCTTMVFEDQHGTLTVSGSDAYGLPTAPDQAAVEAFGVRFRGIRGALLEAFGVRFGVRVEAFGVRFRGIRGALWGRKSNSDWTCGFLTLKNCERKN
jgi:hypothetical protein